MGGSEPELVRKDRGAGDLRVAKLTNTGKSMSRRRRGLAETPALLLYVRPQIAVLVAKRHFVDHSPTCSGLGCVVSFSSSSVAKTVGECRRTTLSVVPFAQTLTLIAVAIFALLPARIWAAPRVPAGTWAIEYQEDTCTLSRDGLGGQPGIAFRTTPLAEPHDLIVYGQFARGKSASFQGWMAIGENREAIQRWMLIEPSHGRKRTHLKTTITADELARLGDSSRLRISGPGGFAFEAALPDMVKPLAALRECEVYLAGRWGIPPTEMELWAKPARPVEDLRNLFWDKDRSRVAMLQSDSIRGVLTIDASGRMVDCKIVEATRVSWVNEKFCPTLMERARFEPARDSAGIAVVGKVITPPIRSARLR